MNTISPQPLHAHVRLQQLHAGRPYSRRSNAILAPGNLPRRGFHTREPDKLRRRLPRRHSATPPWTSFWADAVDGGTATVNAAPRAEHTFPPGGRTTGGLKRGYAADSRAAITAETEHDAGRGVTFLRTGNDDECANMARDWRPYLSLSSATIAPPISGLRERNGCGALARLYCLFSKLSRPAAVRTMPPNQNRAPHRSWAPTWRLIQTCVWFSLPPTVHGFSSINMLLSPQNGAPALLPNN